MFSVSRHFDWAIVCTVLYVLISVLSHEGGLRITVKTKCSIAHCVHDFCRFSRGGGASENTELKEPIQKKVPLFVLAQYCMLPGYGCQYLLTSKP